MNRVAIALSTCDRVELTKRSIEPLLQPDKFHLFWCDGSKTEQGKKLVFDSSGRGHESTYFHPDVTGGSGAAIVYALTTMLAATKPYITIPFAGPAYDYVGLVENDVFLDPDWFIATMNLFEQGEKDGLKVGAVSARCYDERVLISRPNYNIVHNLGAGMVIFTRKAAQLILDTYRTICTTDNRRIFQLISGIDIASTWAFKGSEHWLCGDWAWDTILAANGFASLALSKAKCQMIGQTPSLAEQGLTLSTGPIADKVDEAAFARYRDTLTCINDQRLKLPDLKHHRELNGTTTYFAHQLPALGAVYSDNFRLRDSIGYGPFGWKANPEPSQVSTVTVPILGPCDFLVAGGIHPGKAQVTDHYSGYTSSPDLPSEAESGQVMYISVPGNAYRTLTLTITVPGQTFFGVRCRDPQPVNPTVRFNHNTLPKV